MFQAGPLTLRNLSVSRRGESAEVGTHTRTKAIGRSHEWEEGKAEEARSREEREMTQVGVGRAVGGCMGDVPREHLRGLFLRCQYDY